MAPETSHPLLIYGANGYSGRRVVREALARGLRPVLAGRDPGRVRSLAEPSGLEARAFDLRDGSAADRALRGMRLVLNCAGPFAQTARPVLDACLRNGVHYLDIAGEVLPVAQSAERDQEARRRGVMVMPGVGFDVVPSDCLVAHTVRRLPAVRSIDIGIAGLELISRGSAVTAIDLIGDGVWLRRAGKLVQVPTATVERPFDFGDGPSASVAVSWADVVCAYHSTGVPDITVHFQATVPMRLHNQLVRAFDPFWRFTGWRPFLRQLARALPDGPDDQTCADRHTALVVEARDGRGRVVASRLTAPEAYTTTALTSVAIARRVLDGDLEVGFQTPSRVYGADFILKIPGCRREDLS